MSRFRIGRISGDNPIRGHEATVTRIRYHSPPPRIAITNINDDDGLSSRKLVYEDRGVTGILQSNVYPRSKTLTLLSREAVNKPVVRYEPRHTPPDCFEAQDDALRKAEILLQETQRAETHADHDQFLKQTEAAKPPRRDSAVSEDDEPEPESTPTATKPREAVATVVVQEKRPPASIEPSKQRAPAVVESSEKRAPAIVESSEKRAPANIESQDTLARTPSPAVLASTEPQIIITTTEPLSHREDPSRDSPKRRKVGSSPKSSSPAQVGHVQPRKLRAESESQFVKPKTPPAPTCATPARGESVVSVRSTDSKSSRRSRGSRAIKDDLTIDSKFGMDANEPDEMEYKAANGRWYSSGTLERPEWAIDERPKTKVVAVSSRRSTGGWRTAGR